MRTKLHWKLSNKNKLLNLFSKLYPNPESELNYKNNYQLLICVMLSAQCTDKKVNEVTPSLFKHYPNFTKLSKARLTSIEKIIRPINYYKNKAKYIKQSAEIIAKNYHNRIPKTFDDLTKLPGVGQKTANVILSQCGITPALPVDTHVFRVSKRLQLAQGVKLEIVEEELKAKFDKKLWKDLHHWLILHGRRICKAQNPQCSICQIAELCPNKKT